MAQDEISSIVEFSVNLKDAEQPDPLPIREYTAAIRGAEVRLSQRGTKYADVAFFVSPDQYPVDYTDGNPDGTVLHYRRVSLEDNPQSRYAARRFCEAIGAPLGKKVDVTEWVGLEATIETGHETYEGVTRPVILRVREA